MTMYLAPRNNTFYYIHIKLYKQEKHSLEVTTVLKLSIFLALIYPLFFNFIYMHLTVTSIVTHEPHLLY